VEHPARVVKHKFGHVTLRYRGLSRNSAQLVKLFALSNLWMVRRRLDVLDWRVPTQRAEFIRKCKIRPLGSEESRARRG
jgi:hypothetical protein